MQEETADVLARLIRFDTVNPPGNERECQEWIAGYLREAGLDVELLGAEPDRPDLVARLKGDEPGPVLGYLSHVDTVLADPGDWSHDPWSGDVADGYLWGRGALDMKSQTAAEIVAAATLARSGWRPAKGELKIISVVDEEVGGRLGAQWLTEQRPDVALVDWLVNEGGGAVMPYGDRRLFGVCCAEKGTFRFTVRARGKAGHASVPGVGDNALLKLAPVIERLGAGRPASTSSRSRARCSRRCTRIPPTPRRRGEHPRHRAAPGRHGRPDAAGDRRPHPHLRLRQDQRDPRTRGAPGRLPRAARDGGRGDDGARARAGRRPRRHRDRLHGAGGREPLSDRLAPDGRDPRAGSASRSRTPRPSPSCSPPSPTRAGSARRSRTASPTASSPIATRRLYDTWPLVHSSDERIDLRDLAFATDFFIDLPRRTAGP